MKRFLTVLLSLSFLLACNDETSEVQLKTQDDLVFADTNIKVSAARCEKFTFRWLEIFNDLYSSKIRHIDIFLDSKAVNEANLRKLFEHLSKANPEPDHLTVSVFSDWAQLDPAAPNCPGSGASNMPEPPDKYDYLQATYWRRGERQYFRYSPKTKVPESEFKTVVISPKESVKD